MVTPSNRLEVLYLDGSSFSQIGYSDLTLNQSSGAGRTTCRFIATGESLQKAGELVRPGGVIAVDQGGDTPLFIGQIRTIDFDLSNALATVSAETTVRADVIQRHLRGNLRSILSQPPLRDTFVEYPEVLEPVVDDLLNTPRSTDQLIRDCYQHNIIIDRNGIPHNIAEGVNVINLDPTKITAGSVRVINGRHTPKGLFNDGKPIAGVKVAGVVAGDNNIENHVYVEGEGPIVFTDNREAVNLAWATLFGRESTRTIIRESAELKVTMPLNLDLTPLLMVNYPDATIQAFTGIELWTVETASHRVSGSQASTTLVCKVLYENEKWRGG